MPKKQRNAFYFFMKDIQQQYADAGKKISMNELPAVAHPLWKNMSANERKKYEEQAKGQKIVLSSDCYRLTSDGTTVQETLMLAEEAEQKIKQMISSVREFVGIGDFDVERFQMFTPRRVFYVMAFNILCYTEENEYIPIEIGIAEYSIKNGISKTFHKFIYPGRIPTGYTGEAKRHSEDTHQIPITGHEDSEKNYKMLLQNIQQFVDPFENPVFCLRDDLEQTQGCLEWIAAHAGVPDAKDDFRVWDLVYLLMELRAKAEAEIPSEFLALEILKKNTFDYSLDSRCAFHEELDIPHCALGRAKRLCFLLSDALCRKEIFDIHLTDKHLPLMALEAKPYEVILPNSKSCKIPEPLVPRGIGRGLAVSCSTSQPLKHTNSATNNVEQFRPSSRSSTTSSVTKTDLSETTCPRQPHSVPLEKEMAHLKLTATAVVPGQGIGRGKRRKPL